MANNNNNKTLNVPNKRFPEFIGEWKKCKLGDVANLTKGIGISKDQRSPKGNPCILYGELYTTYKSEMITDIVSKTNIDSANLVKSRYNDVIIPASGETAIDISTARCVQYNDVLLGGDLNIIRLNDGNDGSFFSYQLNGVRKRDIAKVAQGVSVVHLYGENLKAIKVNSPELAEQNKISSLLCLIDQRISTQNKIINKLESLIKGLGDSLINEKIPKTNFSNVYVKAGEGGTPTTSKSEYYDGGAIPFIKIDDLTNKYIISNKDYITELGLQKSSAWIIPPKSIIYSNGATIGAISINIYSVCTKQGVLGIVPTNMIDLEYLYYFMKSTYFRKQVSRIVTEGTMKTAYLKDINNIHCPIPELKTQQAISKTLRSISEKMMDESNILNHYKKVKEYLLQQMFI